jgi:hypothetical protein
MPKGFAQALAAAVAKQGVPEETIEELELDGKCKATEVEVRGAVGARVPLGGRSPARRASTRAPALARRA